MYTCIHNVLCVFKTIIFFLLMYIVLPIIPSNIQFPDISSTHARCTWELTNKNEDDLPDNITIQLSFENGTLASEYVVNGTETELNLDLVPGMNYNLEMISANIDGESMTMSMPFRSIDGRKCTN